MVKNYDKNTIFKIIGKSVLFASIQAALGSVEMSSKFSVINFAKDQETLQNAANALCSYFIIAVIWTFGSSLVLYSQYGWQGIFFNCLANGLMILWIVGSYVKAFRQVAKKNDLKFPSLFGCIF